MSALAIEVEGLTKTFGRDTVALSGIDFSVPAGTVCGVLGHNGAGKTTTINILSTLIRPSSGRASVAGYDIIRQPSEVRASIGMAGQFTGMDPMLTGRENLVLFGRLRGLNRKRAKARADELLQQFDLVAAADRRLSTYSGGMFRRVDLASALVVPPQVLFLDEPTTGLDPRSRRDVWALVSSLRVQGITVLLTTQYLEEAEQLADRICVIDGGQVVAEGTPAGLKAGIGMTQLWLTVPSGSLSRAATVLSPHAAGAIRLGAPDDCPAEGRVEMPVVRRHGLVTDVVQVLAGAGITVHDLRLREPSLDDVFHELTRRPSGEPGPPRPPVRAVGRSKRTGTNGGAAPAAASPRNAREGAASVLPAMVREVRRAVTDVRVLAWRTLARIVRTPEQLLNVTVQPLVIVLLFSYVFNGAIVLPGNGDYRGYLIAGIFAVNMGGTAQGAAIGLAVDLADGLIDRFRSLPMNRAMVLAGRTLADLVMTVIAAVVTTAGGLIVGWRVHAGPADTLLAIGLALLFAYAAAWTGACVGLFARGAESAQAVGLTVLVPLSLTSNAFISTARLTPWLRDVANWNPISVLAAACRQLLGNPNPAAAIQSWPMQHPAVASALWSGSLIAVMVPLAVFLYIHRAKR
ncbi:MAG TPA: ATP-binding cassette domain-containing protein [Trebonia sp.]|nr:ATP-binding cassette domain-containing protein [Trebonia sp.]